MVLPGVGVAAVIAVHLDWRVPEGEEPNVPDHDIHLIVPPVFGPREVVAMLRSLREQLPKLEAEATEELDALIRAEREKAQAAADEAMEPSGEDPPGQGTLGA